MIDRPHEMTRETRETTVRVRVGGAAAEAPVRVSSGEAREAFLEHMMATLSRYSGLALAIEANGDLRHHTIEDVGIALGAALRDGAPTARVRFGHAVVPMDDALVEVALDAGDRPYYAGRLPSGLYEHFLRSFALEAKWTLHVRVLRGRDRHHVVEAAFKALGLALAQALRPAGEVFSTKGPIRVSGPC